MQLQWEARRAQITQLYQNDNETLQGGNDGGKHDRIQSKVRICSKYVSE